MVNSSKINDPRFWEKWTAAGAVGDLSEAEGEVEKLESIIHFERQYRTEGNLTASEIKEYIRFEFRHGPRTIDEQVRRYYLMVKRGSPHRAFEMMEKASPYLDNEARNIDQVRNLCLVLYQYLSGFLIRDGKECYTVHNNQFQKC